MQHIPSQAKTSAKPSHLCTQMTLQLSTTTNTDTCCRQCLACIGLCFMTFICNFLDVSQNHAFHVQSSILLQEVQLELWVQYGRNQVLLVCQ